MTDREVYDVVENVVSQAVCIEDGNKQSFDYNTDTDILPAQISGEITKIPYNYIRPGGTCLGVASLFINILNDGRAVIIEKYKSSISEIESFQIAVNKPFEGPKLLIRDTGKNVTALHFGGRQRETPTWIFVDRTAPFEDSQGNSPMNHWMPYCADDLFNLPLSLRLRIASRKSAKAIV